ncbi:unnamed protein product [Cuscuta epithymum]|uniref:Secreted protein n=1 Tax=Cuscuta epithymum TaxID=186058 RepID=A0AAV0FEA2_9ASTE|nr:unnamed protein product [Cuscuta epithymum]
MVPKVGRLLRTQVVVMLSHTIRSWSPHRQIWGSPSQVQCNRSLGQYDGTRNFRNFHWADSSRRYQWAEMNFDQKNSKPAPSHRKIDLVSPLTQMHKSTWR